MQVRGMTNCALSTNADRLTQEFLYNDLKIATPAPHSVPTHNSTSENNPIHRCRVDFHGPDLRVRLKSTVIPPTARIVLSYRRPERFPILEESFNDFITDNNAGDTS